MIDRNTLSKPGAARTPIHGSLTRLVMILAIGCGLAGSAVAESKKKATSSRKIASFRLPDYHGREVSFGEFADNRPVVVCFLGTQCPLAKFYGPRLQEMSESLKSKGVVFLGVNANVQDSLTEIAGYARRHRITFPILKDLRGQVAEQFGATRTPEVFLLDKQGVVRYQGRVDGQFTFGSGVGLAKPNAARADLKIAIDELLAGKPISVAKTEAKGCLLGRVRETVDKPTVTYAKHISRLVQKHCLECHRDGQIAPFAMETYEDVAGWGEMIAEVVDQQRMPPWHAGDKSKLAFLNDARLSEDEKELIYQWVEEGCPEGDPSDLPKARKFRSGWFTKGGFDDEIYISDKPVPVKAKGIEEYRYYEVPGYKEDRFLETIECLPGNKEVVHHIILYARPPGGEPIAPGSIGVDTKHYAWLGGFAPGTRPLEMPKGWARMIPAGYSLVFEMHYTPVGVAAKDRSGVGLVFMQPEEVKRVLHTGAVVNGEFAIKPHDPNAKVVAELPFNRDTTVVALFPHMHVRGKSFRYTLQHPSGRREILLDVPTYDFNWQNSYTLKEPMVIRKGSILHCVAHYDNSDNNPANPNPDKEVTWGPQSWDEMMIGFYDQGVTLAEARKLFEHKAKELAAEREMKKGKRKSESGG